MATWERVVSGFDAEDETINFGSRNVAETNGAIYESWTLATIQSVGEVLENPTVTATLSNERLCVAVDNCITIFDDQSCQNILATWKFNSAITTYSLSANDSQLLVALDSGKLHDFQISDGGRQVFCIDFVKKINCSKIIKIILDKTDENALIIMSNGEIYKIQLVDNSEEENTPKNVEYWLEKIQLIASTNSQVQYAAQVEMPMKKESLVLLGDDLYVWPDRKICSMTSHTSRYRKVQFFSNYRAMICLQVDGSISIVTLDTLLSRKMWSGPVLDFITLPDESQEVKQMLVLMSNQTLDTNLTLNLMSFPDFEVVFTMPVPSTTYLVDGVSGKSENLLFLEGMTSPQGLVATLRIKAIGESQPEYRLQRLLRQGRFEEALLFAQKFKLDVESIYRTQASILMHQLCPRPCSQDSIQLETLLDILDKIFDVKFVHDCCNNALAASFQDNSRLLAYAKQRLATEVNSTTKSADPEAQRLLHEVSNTLRKLETFEIVRKIQGSVDSNDWIEFSRADLLQECIKYLSLGELHSAMLIWIRHTGSIAQRVDRDVVKRIFAALPRNLESAPLLAWLRRFVPSIESILPAALADIIDWGCRKTRSLEKHHSWPEIGLEFARGLVDLMHFEEYNACFYLHQQFANKNSEFHRLTALVQAMVDLLNLKTNFRVVIPLATYLGSPIDVVTLLLNRVHVDVIPTLLQNFLQQFMLNHALSNDQVLATVVMNTLKISKAWWLWDKAPWDRRLAGVVAHVHNVQTRLQLALDVLRKAPVPWSESLVALAEQCCLQDHPLVEKIRLESNSVPMRIILKKCGFAQVGLCNKLFCNIIKKDRPSVIADIFELTKTNFTRRQEVFYMCVNYHLNQGNIERVMEILRELSDDLLANCCKHIICVAKSKMNNLKLRDDSLKAYFEILGPIEKILREIFTRKNPNSVFFNDIWSDISLLRATYRLQEEFQLIYSINDYITQKEEIILVYIAEHLNENCDWSKFCKKLDRLNNLLCLSKFYGFYQLLEEKNDCPALDMCIINYIDNMSLILPEETEYTKKICSLLVRRPSDDPKMAVALKNIFRSCLLSSKVEDLHQDMSTMRQIDAYHEAVGSVFETETELSSTWQSKTDKLKIYTIYKDASVSPGTILLPLLRDCRKMCDFYDPTGVKTSDTDDKAIEILSKTMYDRVRTIQNEYHDLSLLKIIGAIHAELGFFLPSSTTTKSNIQSIFTHCLTITLKKVISSRQFDLHLGLTCLFLLPEPVALSIITSETKRFSVDVARLRLIADLGHEYCRLSHHQDQQHFHMQKTLHCWAQHLVNYDIPYREILQSELETNRSIMRRLMASKRPEVIDLLRDFCQTFGFDLNHCLMSYLQMLLCSWQPIYTIKDQREMKIDEDDVANLRSLCLKILQQIDSSAALSKLLCDLNTQINFYHYEAFLILAQLTKNKNPHEISYLHFLKNYTRVSAPTEIEHEQWNEYSQDNQSLPAIAKWRLPYLPRLDQPATYKLITPELNLKTYENWLRIGPLLKMPEYVVCTIAAKGTWTEAWKSVESRPGEWLVNARHTGLLKDIRRCLDHIPEAAKLQYAMAALYSIVNHTPAGADKAAAAQECYRYSQDWQLLTDTTQDNLQDKIQKIKEKYLHYTAKHILHSHGLGTPRYLNLVDRPEKLVYELYQDETIAARYRGAVDRRPDVNAAVHALGQLFELNLTRVSLALLQEWLQPETYDRSANDSITMSNFYADPVICEAFCIDDNLLKACYIVDADDSKSYVKVLINISMSEDPGDGDIPGKRLRALQVLQSVTDEATLRNLVRRDVKLINRHRKALQYVSELERLGLDYSVAGFEANSKSKLVQILVSRQYCSPRALALIPQIYVDFQLEDYTALNVALLRMAQMPLLQALRRTVAMLTPLERVVNCAGFVEAWQVLVDSSFSKLEGLNVTENMASCVEMLQLLDTCPVIDKLRFAKVVESCLHSGHMQFAAALVPFLHRNDQEAVIETLVRSDGYAEMWTQLGDFAEKGILMIRQAMLMLEAKKSAL